MEQLPLVKIVGSLNKKPLYTLYISRATYARAQELTASGLAPDWTEQQSPQELARVATTDPEWFIELDKSVRIQAAASPR